MRATIITKIEVRSVCTITSRITVIVQPLLRSSRVCFSGNLVRGLRCIPRTGSFTVDGVATVSWNRSRSAKVSTSVALLSNSLSSSLVSFASS